MIRATFVTWDGPAQRYLESLYFPMLARAGGHGVEFDVFQLTDACREHRRATEAAAKRHGIDYRAAAILRRPRGLGSLATLGLRAPELARHLRSRRTDVVVPRSVFAAGVARAALHVGPAMPLVYDSDGLSADERVEFQGLRAGSPQHRLMRQLEEGALRRAEVVLTRTDVGARVLRARAGAASSARFMVVGNGSDTARFTPAEENEKRRLRRERGLEVGATIAIYAGSLSAQYLPEAMVALHRKLLARDPRSMLVVLTGHLEEAERLVQGLPRSVVRRVAPEEVAGWLRCADLGLALRRASFSQRGVAPIKVGEYLLSGLPVLATRGVGDLDRLLDPSPAASLVEEESLERGLDGVVARVRAMLADRSAPAEARALGLAHFDASAAAQGYAEAVRRAVER